MLSIADMERDTQERLFAYLRQHLEGDWGNAKIRPIVGGQSNPTYLIDAGEKLYVLRKQPGGTLLPSAHAVDREFRVMHALAETKVPVPRVLHFCASIDIVGTPFYVMVFVTGRVFKDPLLPQLQPAERAAVYDGMVTTLGALHMVDYASIGLADFGRPGNYFGRQIDRWSRQYRDAGGNTIAAMDELIHRLPQFAPDDNLSSIVHGDFRLENLLIAPQGTQVLAVVDWELSTLGHPLADLAYNCFYFRLPRHVFLGMGETNLAGTGIPSEDEYVSAYFRHTGITPSAPWPFYIAFAFFRLAAILHGMLQRAMKGNAKSDQAATQGILARPCAEAGLAALRIIG